MAFVTGSAASISDLLSAIQTACTSNGWALSAGGVLSKGGCFTELKIAGTLISIRGGTGVDGSGNLTGAGNTSVGYIGLSFTVRSTSSNVVVAFAYPVTYFIHVMSSPDEVYVVVNYASTFYQNIAWGKSTMPGLNGSGNWYVGSPNQTNYGGSQGWVGSCFEYGNQNGLESLFMRWEYSGPTCTGVHHALDTVGDWKTSQSVANSVYFRDWGFIAARSPNSWNSEAILVPIRVYASRPSSLYSPILECAHARLIRIDNLDDQQIITLGPDRWRIYPWFHRGPNDAQTSPGTGSGTCGHAIRYDGP